MGNKVILIGILSAFIIGIILFFIFPQMSEIRSLRSQYTTKRNEFEKTKELSRRFDELRARYIAFQERGEAEKMGRALPRGEELPELLVQLEAIAVQTTGGAIIRSVNFSPQVKETGPSEVAINMQLSASYAGIKEFLVNLAKNRRLIDLNSISFAVVAGNEEESVYDFTLEARAYFQP